MLDQASLDVALECTQAPTQQVDVLARVTHLQLVGFTVMSPHRLFGSLDQGTCQPCTMLPFFG